MELKKVQERIIKNKIEKGFGVGDINQEFLLLYGEVNEAYMAHLKGDKENLKEELADVAIYLLGISEMLGVDLEKEIDGKLKKNERRTYVTLENGTHVKLNKLCDVNGKELASVFGKVVVDENLRIDLIDVMNKLSNVCSNETFNALSKLKITDFCGREDEFERLNSLVNMTEAMADISNGKSHLIDANILKDDLFRNYAVANLKPGTELFLYTYGDDYCLTYLDQKEIAEQLKFQ